MSWRGFAERGPAPCTAFSAACFGCWEAELSSALGALEKPRGQRWLQCPAGGSARSTSAGALLQPVTPLLLLLSSKPEPWRLFIPTAKLLAACSWPRGGSSAWRWPLHMQMYFSSLSSVGQMLAWLRPLGTPVNINKQE